MTEVSEEPDMAAVKRARAGPRPFRSCKRERHAARRQEGPLARFRKVTLAAHSPARPGRGQKAVGDATGWG